MKHYFLLFMISFILKSMVTAQPQLPNPANQYLKWTAGNAIIACPAPQIHVAPDTLNFDTTLTGYIVTSNLTVQNLGSDTLIITAIQTTNFFFLADTSHLRIAPADSFALPVSFLPVTPTHETGELLILSNDPLRDTLMVHLQGWGWEPPIIDPWLSPDSIQVTVPEGDSVSVDLRITNNSANVCDWQAAIEYLPSGLGDTLFTRDITALAPGNPTEVRGVAFDGENIWIAGAGPGVGAFLYRFDRGWNFLSSYQQPVTHPQGFVDLVFNGSMLYGAIGNLLIEIDPISGLATGTNITTPVSNIRAATANPATGDFWVCDTWQTIYVLDHSGILLNQFPYTGASIGGLAWDQWSPGGPFVWFWIADGPPEGPNCTAVQLSANSGVMTGVSFVGFEMNGDPSQNDQPAGAAVAVIDSQVTFLGLQSSNFQPGDGHDFVVGYSLGMAPHNWLRMSHNSGSVMPWTADSVEIKIFGFAGAGNDTLHSAKIIVDTNNPYFPTGVVPVTVGVSPLVGTSDPSRQVAGTFALLPNYPNPFNSMTAISYQLSAVSHVELVIYNILGQKVKTLVRRKQVAGEYLIRWDGRDDAGQEVASGVYIYGLKAGGMVMSRKMLLVK